MLDQLRCYLSQGANNAFECRGNIGEVCNTTSDEQNLAVWMLGCAEHQVKDRALMLRLSLRLGRSTAFKEVAERATDARLPEPERATLIEALAETGRQQVWIYP